MIDWLDDRAAFAASDARSLAAGRLWVDSAAQAAIAAAFAGVADVEAAAEAAERLFADAAWVADLLAPLTAHLRADPRFVPPLRVHRDALRTGAVLYEGAAATVSASVISADALATLPAPATVVAGGRVSVVRYCQAGGATLRVWEAGAAEGDLCAADAPCCTPAPPVALADGMVLRLDGRVRAHLVEDARADVVLLTATLKHGAAAHAREYARGDGRLVRVATLDDAGSRTRMLLTLLRLSTRRDANACFEAATHDRDFTLRWAAMREWLALDVEAALPRLAAMTRDANAEVRAAATTTLAMIEGRAPSGRAAA